MGYKEVQQIAKDTMQFARENICAGMRLPEIREMCEHKMLELGADSFWYWDVGAFIFAGDETVVSVSGTQYQTSDRIIKTDDIITIDLSPQKADIWGDYARTLIVENGRVAEDEKIVCDEWKRGLFAEKILHDKMREFVTPRTTFEELYEYMNGIIVELGYVNLDFMGNLGHSVAKKKEDRIYIEKENRCCLGEVSFFTFEPHIGIAGSQYGYKRENIYYFSDSHLIEL